MTYTATKTFGHDIGLSCAFRQWRAKDSHCRFIHGYALAIMIEFEAERLDDRNWVVDFGGLKVLKDRLIKQFDHKLVVAADDPELPLLIELDRRGLADIQILDHTGCEAFASVVYTMADGWLAENVDSSRVRVRSVTVSEHGANSASYSE